MAFVKAAMRGVQGVHEFFVSSFAWGELDQMAVLPEDLPHLDEERQMQRLLARKRIGELSDYLTRAPDHFFSALTLIILPRDMETGSVVGRDYRFTPNTDRPGGLGDTGVLELSGSVRLLPADGQHRLRGAIEAMKRHPSIAEEAVPVVLLPFESTDQVRQLFADLNLNAKPVNKTVGYAYDSRDREVLIAKEVMTDLPLFESRVNLKSNSLPKSSSNVITLNVLVDGTRTLAEASREHSVRSGGKDLQRLLTKTWQSVVDPFVELDNGSGWSRVLEGNSGAAGKLRDEYVFPHGLGWKALTRAAAALIREHGLDAWASVYEQAVTSIDWRRDNPGWQGLATNNGRVNNTEPNVKATARLILDIAAGEAKRKNGLPLREDGGKK